MLDELKCVSQGCNRGVIKYEKYDVNGFRFHTKTHQNGRANQKMVNTGEDPSIYRFWIRPTILVRLCMEAKPIHIILLILSDVTVTTLGNTFQLI